MSCCSEVKKEVPTQNNCCAPEETKDSSCCSSESSEELVQITPSQSKHENSCSSDVEDDSSCCDTDNEKTPPRVEGEKIEYKIEGMDCPSCATTIEKGLQRLNSVLDATVSYSNEKLQLVVNEGYSTTQLVNTVQNLGFTMNPVTKSNHIHAYDVQGMDCGGCAKSIEKHLMGIDGVRDVHVNFATGKMQAEHTTSIDRIIKEVSKIGFDASLHANQSNGKGKSKNKIDLGKIIISGILITTGFVGTYTGLPSIASIFLFVIAIIISGYHPIKSAYYAVKSRSLDMNVLMSSAAIGAAIIGEWFEGATVVWLFSLGIYLQNRSMDQTRKSIRNLMDLAPSMAWLQVGDELIQKPVEEVAVGETIIIKPGDKIPLDGQIMHGESSINQAAITGESLPVDKSTGETVFAGTINESGSLDVQVTKLAEDTTLSKIIYLVEEAQDQKAPTEAFIDKFASIYTPFVFILALSVIVLPPLLGFGAWGEWAYKGLALLVVACPCALVISTPVAIVSAIGNAAKNGVLIKGGTFLESAGAVNAIAFDKTGTLTKGEPKVSDIHPVNISEKSLLSIAQTLESRSTHPIAKTLVSYAQDKEVPLVQAELYKNIVGRGVEATIDGELYYAGNLRLMEDKNIAFDEEEVIKQLEKQGKTIILISSSQELLGIIAVSDTIRSTSVHTLEALSKVGMKELVMLTGDNERTANSIAQQAGISRYVANLLPEDKVNAVKEIQNERKNVAMVGDGINDAPALATADLGIAMGVAGTDTAMETADVVLMADNLKKLPYTVKLSRKALAIIKQNIWFSLIIKFVALALIFPGWLTLWMAVLSDTGAAIIVILNALRLLKVKD